MSQKFVLAQAPKSDGHKRADFSQIWCEKLTRPLFRRPCRSRHSVHPERPKRNIRGYLSILRKLFPPNLAKDVRFHTKADLLQKFLICRSSILFLLLSFCWIGNGYAVVQQTSYKENLSHSTPQSTLLNNLPEFSALDIMGPIKVTLSCQQQKQNVTIGLPPAKKAEQVDTSVQKNTLLIDAHPRQFQATPISIHINTNQPLSSLVARGSATVEGENCGDPNLIVVAKNTASIHLKGTNMLHAIQNDSANDIVISGVNSQNLMLGTSANKSRIILSGKTQELNVRLQGSVLLDARRLEARTAHILTDDNAAAYVDVTEVLYGFADGNSNIYYERYPQRVMKDTHASGNVLKVY